MCSRVLGGQNLINFTQAGAPLQEFKKKGVIGQSITVAEMGDKVLAVRNGLTKIAFETIKTYAQKTGAEMGREGLTEAVEHWARTVEWADKHLEVLEKVEKAATVITIVVGAIKVIDAIRRGEWGEAIKEAASTGFTLAVGAAAGTAGTIMLAGVTVLVAAELQGISGAAAMIRYAKEANEAEAFGDFMSICKDAAKLEASELIADVEVLKDPANAGEKARIEAKLEIDSRDWNRHLHRLGEMYSSDRVNTIGGQPGLRKSLGANCQRVLAAPSEASSLTGEAKWDLMARQMHAVFVGAKAMSQHLLDEHTKE